jgi:uncharacterized repeat protein (TIGR01451 family)
MRSGFPDGRVFSRVTVLLTIAVLIVLPNQTSWAVGTSAGTDIINQVTVSYGLGGIPQTPLTSSVTIPVDEVLDVDVQWQDATTLIVPSGANNQALTFRVTNIGNGTEPFVLSAVSGLPGDQFSPILVDLYIDDGDGVFEPGTDDPAYVPGTATPPIPEDGWLNIFVVNDIPSGLSNGDAGRSELTAACQTAAANTTLPATPGGTLPGLGDSGVDAVIGLSGGVDTDIGAYQISDTALSLVKAQSVSDPTGGTDPVTGAVITYTITVTVTGSDDAAGLVVTDPIPNDTTYIPGTLTVSPGPAISATVSGSPPTVNVDMGDLNSGNTPQNVTFQVTIN